MKRKQPDLPGMFAPLKSMREVVEAIEESILPTTWPELCQTIRDVSQNISSATEDPYRKRLALRIRQYLAAAEELVANNSSNVPYAVFMLGVKFSRLQLLEFDTEVKEAQRAAKRRGAATKGRSKIAQEDRAELFEKMKPVYLRLAGNRSHSDICADLANRCERSKRFLIDLMQPLNVKKKSTRKR